MASNPQATAQTLTEKWKDKLENLTFHAHSNAESLEKLSRNSRIDNDDLVDAAQQERAGRTRSKRLPTHKSRQDISRMASFMLHSGGFDKFAERLNTMFAHYGVERPTLQADFRNVSVTTRALVGSAGVATVGNILPQLFQDLIGHKGETVTLHVLKDLNGSLKPRRFTLLLGPPGSGKSTFLRLLSGRLKKSTNLKVDGQMTYNGVTDREFVVERTVAYVDQNDNHIPVLTVGETLDFAHTCSTGNEQPDYMAHGKSAPRAVGGSPGGKQKAVAQGEPANGTNGIVSGTANGTTNGHADAIREGGDGEEQPVVMEPTGFAHARGEEDFNQAMFEAIMRDSITRGVRVEMVERLLGIKHTEKTIVGNAMVRGVSGGERKRVTTAEMLVGFQRMLCLDEISTGLDSATLFSIVTFLKQSCAAFNLTTVISLLQPPPEVFQLFDDVILMAEGRIVYHGPTEDVQSFFETLGFVLPPRMDLPSWLQEVTTPTGQWKYGTDELKRRWAASAGSNRGVQSTGALPAVATDASTAVPRATVDPNTGKVPLLVTTEAMTEAFYGTNQHGKAMLQELEHNPFDPASGHPRALVKQRYALSIWRAIKVDTARQWLLFIRNRALINFRTVQLVLIGIIIGTLFYNLPANLNSTRQYFGATFLSVLFIAFGSAPELSLLIQNRTVWYKHRNNLFLPASAEAISMACVRALNTVWESVIFSSIVYWMVGYVREPGAYFTYLLIISCIGWCMSGLFRFIGAVAPTPTHAQAFGMLGILMLVLTSGFAIVRTSIPPWWIWAYYISPFAYALRAIVINEMTSSKWDAPTSSGVPTGISALDSFGFFTDRKWIWIGVGYMIGFYLLMNFLTWVGLRFYSGQQRRASVPDERALARARAEAEARRQSAEAAAATAVTAGSAPTDTTVAISSGLKFTPITLVFRDLRYFVPNPAAGGTGKKGAAAPAKGDGKVAAAAPAADAPPAELELLKGITGFTQPGVLTALMGGSGAGKTTLLDVLAGRKTVGRITGDILVNGHPKDQKTWSRVVGYCEQMDIHTPATTVAEALWFSARLRLPKTVSDQQVRAYVDEVTEIVDLLPNINDLVGSPGVSGLSTEQRKRLTIAVEMVANPSLLFLDEPTSGLDARAAAIVMQAVSNVARNGRTVLVTIHQPSINIFEAFHQLLLLQRGGRVTFFGPLGLHSSELVSYLEAVPGTVPIRNGYNPATWMLEVTGGSMATTAAHNDVDWPELYRTGPLGKANAAKADELVQQCAATAAPLTVEGGRYAQPFPVQLLESGRKLSLAYWRMPSYNFMRIIITCICGLIYGSMYYKLGNVSNPATVASVQNVIGVLFSSSQFLGSINLMSVMPVISVERVVFYRERAASMYDPFATGLSMAIAEFPYVLAQTVLFVPIVYFMVAFQLDAAKFFYFFLMVFIDVMLYTTFGIFLVVSTPAVEIATIFSSAFNFFFNMFNGFSITYNDMPVGWKWANRITPTTWVLYGLGASQLGDNYTPLITTGNTVPTTTVSAYLYDNFGFDYGFRWYCIPIVLAYVAFFRIGGIISLKYVNYLKR